MPFTDMLKPVTDSIEEVAKELEQQKTNTAESFGVLAQASIEAFTSVEKELQKQRWKNYFFIVWPIIVAVIFKWVS